VKPSRIVLIRHGQSHGNVNREVHATVPDWKIELTAKGFEQATKAGHNLVHETGVTPIGVYTSPYRRTMQTWDEIALAFAIRRKPIAFVKEDLRLREQEWGALRAFEPRKWEEIEAERDAYGTLFYRFLHGESGCDVVDRCSDFLATLYRDFEKPDMPDQVLIVTHGFLLRALLMRWLHWSVETFHNLSNPRNCETFELRLNASDRYELTKPFPTKADRPHHEPGGHRDKREPR